MLEGNTDKTGGQDMRDVGLEILERLIELKYDWLKPSNFKAAPDIKCVNTLQMLLIGKCNVFLLPTVLHELYQDPSMKGRKIYEKL